MRITKIFLLASILLFGSSGSLLAGPWTTSGNTGTVDERDLQKVNLTALDIGIKRSVRRGSIISRYNITAVDNFNNINGFWTFNAVFKDAGNDAQVIAQIMEYDRVNGTRKLVAVINSNDFDPSEDFQDQRIVECGNGPVINFRDYVYVAQVRLIKRSATADPRLRSLKAGFTLC